MDEPEPALDLAAAVAPLRDPRVALRAGTMDQRPAAVPSATLRARHCRSICLWSRHPVVPLVVPLQPEVGSTPSNSDQLRNHLFPAQMRANRNVPKHPWGLLWSRRSGVRVPSLTLVKSLLRGGFLVDWWSRSGRLGHQLGINFNARPRGRGVLRRLISVPSAQPRTVLASSGSASMPLSASSAPPLKVLP